MHVLVVLLAGVVAAAATAPVAMRVEVEPLRPVGDNTEVALIVQIAPMDRSRIGSNAIVRIELDEGRVSSGSPMRAVGAEDDGSFRVLVEWPPGEHSLRVAIEGPNREDSGLWVGTVRIPDLSKAVAVQETVEPKSDPDPEIQERGAVEPPPAPQEIETLSAEPPPEPAPVETEAPEIEPSPKAEPEAEIEAPPPPVTEAETTDEESPSEAPAAVAATTAAAAATPEAAPSTPPVEPETAPEPEPEPSPSTVDEKPEAVAPEISHPEQPQSDPVPDPVPDPDPDAEVEVAAADEEPLGEKDLPGPSEEPPLVEPLRADPAPSAAEPDTVEPSAPAEQPPLTAPVSVDIAARYDDWERADPGTREFSVIAMRGRDPIGDLEAGDLRLRIGGSDVAVEKLGDSKSAPLLLGLAIDLESDDVEAWSGMQGSLAPITDRAGGGRGRLFVADSGGVGDWGAKPGSRDLDVGSQLSMNVAQQVVASLEQFGDERGRSFLIVLTDGRGEPSKDEWQQASDAAETAGVPILVVALWDDEFSNKTRKNLKKLTVASGGSLFLVQGQSQLSSAADRFGRYLDGGYAVRFRPPLAGQGGAMAISVSATDREITVNAPKSIR
jgi:hypothetical protein